MWIPNFVAKLIGKQIADKLQLEDKPMDTKKWWQSKTIWSGVIAILIAGYNAASTHFGFHAIPDWVFALLGGLGVYGRATSDTKIG